MVAPQTGTPPAERSEAGRHWTGTARQPVQLARPREDTESCGTLLCSALHCGAPQGRTATASTRRPARTGGGVASSRPDVALCGRPIHPPAHGKASRPERRRPGGSWLCIGLHQARRRAAMHKVQHRFPMHDPRDTHRLALCRSTHERKGRHKEGRCHAGGQCALPGAEPEDTAAAIPGSPTRSQHIDSGMGPHDGSRQRAEQAATARAHHRSGHRHLAGHGHRLGGAHGKVGGVEAVRWSGCVATKAVSGF
jgi:hypothetical protein